MLLTISTTATPAAPATDLGYLLHKHPDRAQSFPQSFGTATVVYPEATPQRCTAALLLEVDAVRLARTRGRDSPDFSLAQYVNDRPYAASSLLAVALADVFSTARAGICKARQDLADGPLPLVITIPALPCRGGAEVAHRIFGPLGWGVEAVPVVLDPAFPEWGDSRYLTLTLTGDVRLADALSQLHVLLPVLDESKHYWQGPDEVDKLIRSGGDWLATHPERELVVRRYLGRRTALARVALARLTELDDVPDDVPDDECESESAAEPEAEAGTAPSGEPTDAPTRAPRVPLHTLRHQAVLRALHDVGAETVIDLGCGPGAFLRVLLAEHRFVRVAGADVSARSLQRAARTLRLETMSERQAERLTLFQGALTYEDPRFAGYDAAVLMEVIEHVDETRLPALERVVFGVAAPATVLVTTPNADYNELYEDLVGHRHSDHRFEWTRAQFAAWCERVCLAHGYSVELRGVGEVDADRGTPTQLGVFRRG